MNSCNEFIDKFEQYLDKEILGQYSNNILLDSMRYSVLSGGKRIRPLLSYAIGSSAGLSQTQILPLAVAVELIHCFSLIHDDLPCMDNDDYRRGKLTNHKVYGEAVALLCGDNLQAMAIDILSSDKLLVLAQIKLDLVRQLNHSTSQMIIGQVIDIGNTAKKIGIEEIEQMHLLKTGALIESALVLPLIYVNASNDRIVLVKKLSQKIGLLFQVVDDILDKTSSTDILGKTANKDEQDDKATYVTLFGLAKSKQIAVNLYRDSCDLCQQIENNTIILDLIHMIYNRIS